MPILYISAIIDIAVGSTVLLYSRSDKDRPSITMLRVVLTAIVVATVFGMKLPLWWANGAGIFAVMNLVFIEAVVVVPALAVSVLLAHVLKRRRATVSILVLSTICLLSAPLGAYMRWVEPYRLQLETCQIRLPAGRSGETPLRIGILADIQTDRVTDYERSAVDRIMSQQADVILIPGDICQTPPQMFEKELPAFRKLLSGLSAPGGVYITLGNVDRESEVVRIIEGTDVRPLFNAITRVTVRDRKLTIGGIGSAFNMPGALRIVRQLESLPGDDDVRILISHRPDIVNYLSKSTRIDLVISGHTHGGQIQLPWIGPLVTFSALSREVAAGGYHQLDGRGIYISRGIGHERGQAPRVRLMCPPEISLLTLD